MTLPRTVLTINPTEGLEHYPLTYFISIVWKSCFYASFMVSLFFCLRNCFSIQYTTLVNQWKTLLKTIQSEVFCVPAQLLTNSEYYSFPSAFQHISDTRSHKIPQKVSKHNLYLAEKNKWVTFCYANVKQPFKYKVLTISNWASNSYQMQDGRTADSGKTSWHPANAKRSVMYVSVLQLWGLLHNSLLRWSCVSQTIQ